MDAAFLASQLPHFAPPLTWEVCASTQTAMAEHLTAGRGLPGKWHLALTAAQTAGRGRTGAAWLAEPGDAVLMTLAGPLPLPVQHWPSASLVAGLAAAEALGTHVWLKWPNDLFVLTDRWRKLGGILCERLETRHGAWWLCGLGVNVRSVPEGVADHAAALGGHHATVDIAARLARAVAAGIGDFVAAGGQLPLDRLHGRLAFRATRVALDDGTHGIFHGLTPDGALRVGDQIVRAGAIVRAGDEADAAAGVFWQTPRPVR